VRRIGATLVVLLAAGAAAAAQTVSLEVSQAPHYAGETIDIIVVAEGFDEEPVPSVIVASPPHGQLVAIGIRPSVSTSITIVNGRVQRTKQVKFIFSYRFTSAQPGPVEIGSFVVAQNSNRVTSRPMRLDLQPIPSSDQMSVELLLPEEPVYVGERVPVTLRFTLTGRLQENLHQYGLRAPFFELSETFQFLDPPEAAGTTKVEILTPSGAITRMGHATEKKRNGEKYLVVEVRRIAVPLRAGNLEIPAASLDVEEGVRFRRDLFGGRRPTQVRKWRAVDRARRLVVKQVPAGRTPASFAGAVGSGFSLTVSANRTVVKVGEPIALEFELRGDGNLETAALPRLDSEGLLPVSQFRVPDGEITGRVEEGVKRFTAMVRVLSAGVTEIPALEYAWFDPTIEQFQTTRSRPIALSVGAARIVDAADVQSGERPPDESIARDGGVSAATAPRSGPLVLTGADLAIERDPALLVRPSSGAAQGSWLIAGLYAGSALIVLLAQIDRRRRDVDPAVVERRRRVEAELRRIREASNLPTAEAAAELAHALRALIGMIPEGRRDKIDELVGECDARSYAPTADRDRAPLDPAFHRRALELAADLAENEP
jgi:hypothetical protein